MNEILDDYKIKINNKRHYSLFSFIASLISIALYSYLFSIVPKRIKAGEGFPNPPMSIVIAIQLFCLIGTISMVLSFVHKEPSSWYKWAGGILNVILFILILGIAVIARVV
jgi:drug/metabolite transporter (DMT)-like permease